MNLLFVIYNFLGNLLLLDSNFKCHLHVFLFLYCNLIVILLDYHTETTYYCSFMCCIYVSYECNKFLNNYENLHWGKTGSTLTLLFTLASLLNVAHI